MTRQGPRANMARTTGLGALMTERRKALGKTQRDVANAVPMRLTTYVSIETGKTAVPRVHLVPIARVLGFSLDEAAAAMGFTIDQLLARIDVPAASEPALPTEPAPPEPEISRANAAAGRARWIHPGWFNLDSPATAQVERAG